MKKLTMILLVCIITVGYSVSAYAADWQWINQLIQILFLLIRKDNYWKIHCMDKE